MNDGTSRDALIARNLHWIKQENLHPRTSDYARQYANLTHGALRIISQYEVATDTGDPDAVRRAWDSVIRYIRTLRPAFEDSGRKVA